MKSEIVKAIRSNDSHRLQVFEHTLLQLIAQVNDILRRSLFPEPHYLKLLEKVDLQKQTVNFITS